MQIKNKQLRILYSEPLLFLAFPLAFLNLLVMVLMLPIIKVRVGFLRCDRLGHFAANTELMISEQKTLRTEEKYLDLFYYPRPVCNKQLALMFERRLKVLPWFLLRPICLVVRNFTIFESFRVKEARGGDRDIDNLLDITEPALSFNDLEMQQGLLIMQKMGIKAHNKFICMTVRDSEYLGESSTRPNHQHRDSSINNFLLAAETLANKGYFVLRMGAKVKSHFISKNRMIIDYANSEFRSEFMDVFLGARCEFCISTSTGFDAIPLIFRRPIVYASMVPPGGLFTFSSNMLAITKHHYDNKLKRYLTFEETINSAVGFFVPAHKYIESEIQAIENTPEEIRDVVVEMADMVEGLISYCDEDVDLQNSFWSLYPKDAKDASGVPLHGKIKSRYGSKFLKLNKWWVGKVEPNRTIVNTVE